MRSVDDRHRERQSIGITFWKRLKPIVALAFVVVGLIGCRPAPKKHIVFLCPHGGAKSLIAASYFNRAAENAHVPYIASAAAAEKPYDAVPSKIADLLQAEGFNVRSFKLSTSWQPTSRMPPG